MKPIKIMWCVAGVIRLPRKITVIMINNKIVPLIFPTISISPYSIKFSILGLLKLGEKSVVNLQ